MFVEFFYDLRNMGLPISPTAFLQLQKAMNMGLVNSLEDFYVTARCVMVKSERFFDLYDCVFARHFHGVEAPTEFDRELEAALKSMIEEWLKDPEKLAQLLNIDPRDIKNLDLEELVQYFMDRLKDQTEQHDGGNRWIGTQGTSPVGHSGENPKGMRVGGESKKGTAVKTAMERRYRDYTRQGRLTLGQVGEALKRLKNLKPAGPRDTINIDKTINETVKNAGDIEIVFDRSLRDKLKVILMIDNGGWSMDPYIEVVQALFNYSRSSFKELKVYYYHNCVYDEVWEDPSRRHKAMKIEEFTRLDPDTRLIFVGDASMAPSELEHEGGSIYYYERHGTPAIDRLWFLTKTFRHAVWLNPMVRLAPDFETGPYTVRVIKDIIPMFGLSLDGLEKATRQLLAKN